MLVMTTGNYEIQGPGVAVVGHASQSNCTQLCIVREPTASEATVYLAKYLVEP